jgi:hypothetical protein
MYRGWKKGDWYYGDLVWQTVMNGNRKVPSIVTESCIHLTNPDFFIERRRTVVLVERVFQEISDGIYEGDIVKVNGAQGTIRLNGGVPYLDAKDALRPLKGIEKVEVIGNVMEGVKLTA